MKALSTFLIPLAGVLLIGQSLSSYHVTHTYILGGDGSWDYVVPDPANHRVFIALSEPRGVRRDTGTLLGEVTGINGAHGTALAGSSGHGFATSGNDQAVIMFDAKTFKSLKTHSGGGRRRRDCLRMRLRIACSRLNGDAHSSTVIDSRDGNPVTNIPLGGKPEYGASAGGRQALREPH